MAEMIFILKSVLLPIFIMISLGYVFQKRFKLDLSTLAKLNINVFVQGFIFVKFYKTSLALDMLFYVMVFFIIYVALFYVTADTISEFQYLYQAKATSLYNCV